MNDSDHEKRKDAVVEFLNERPNVSLRALGHRPPEEHELQNKMANRMLFGFLILVIVVLFAAYKYDVRFCPNATRCGENFASVKVVMDTLFSFGSPFIGLIIGFLFSEKFGRRNRDKE